MYISNIEGVKTKRYECGRTIGKYLMKSGIPLLSSKEKQLVFANTKKLQEALNSMPFYLKLLVKVGVING